MSLPKHLTMPTLIKLKALVFLLLKKYLPIKIKPLHLKKKMSKIMTWLDNVEPEIHKLLSGKKDLDANNV